MGSEYEVVKIKFEKLILAISNGERVITGWRRKNMYYYLKTFVGWIIGREYL